jgi:hypothetical protein
MIAASKCPFIKPSARVTARRPPWLARLLASASPITSLARPSAGAGPAADAALTRPSRELHITIFLYGYQSIACRFFHARPRPTTRGGGAGNRRAARFPRHFRNMARKSR